MQIKKQSKDKNCIFDSWNESPSEFLTYLSWYVNAIGDDIRWRHCWRHSYKISIKGFLATSLQEISVQALYSSAHFDIARATLSTPCLVRVRSLSLWCGARFETLRSSTQASRHFGRVRSLSLWRGARFEIAHTTLSALGVSDRSRCGSVLVLSRRPCTGIWQGNLL